MSGRPSVSGTFWVETLGCPKNQVDSDKLTGTLTADGMVAAGSPDEADLVVVNTCAFIEAARQESVDTVLALADQRQRGARLVVTGCMAERYGQELAAALPEADLVAGFGVPVTLAPVRRPTSRTRRSGPSGAAPRSSGPGSPGGADPRSSGPGGQVSSDGRGLPAPAPSLDLLNLPRPPSSAPWAYVKIAEGCDRRCGFCAIPSFRGPQRSRHEASILAEVEALQVAEVVLVAQDLASYGRDQGRAGAVVPLVRAVAEQVARTRLLYLYPSDLSDELIDAIGATEVPYFDLSLQHVSKPLLRRMRRWGDGARFLSRIGDIRRRFPDSAFRSNFIVGYPGETEGDHDLLLRFVEDAQLDWCGFFAYSNEDGTYAADLDGEVAPGLMAERLAELTELQDRITAARRIDLVGQKVEVLVDAVGVGRTHREAPEIDGVVTVPDHLGVGGFHDVLVTGASGPDLEGAPIDLVAS